jgi:hypothetical protein
MRILYVSYSNEVIPSFHLIIIIPYIQRQRACTTIQNKLSLQYIPVIIGKAQYDTARRRKLENFCKKSWEQCSIDQMIGMERGVKDDRRKECARVLRKQGQAT